MLIRSHNDIEFKVYRKPTNILSFIHAYSDHEEIIKKGVFEQMFQRAYKICSPKYLKEEIENIFYIGKKLEYCRNFLDNCNRKVIKKLIEPIEKPTSNFSNCLVLPFNKQLTKLKKPLEIFGVKLIFSYENIKKMLIKNSPPPSENQGVYCIKCADCPQIYQGQCGQEKGITFRIKQHEYDVKRKKELNSIYQHVRDFNHEINFDNPVLIYKSSQYSERNIVESLLISNSYKKNMNNAFGNFKVDAFIVSWFISAASGRKHFDNQISDACFVNNIS